MAENQSFTGDHLRPTTATTFSQLLFSPHHDDDDDDNDVDVDIDKNHHQIFDYSVSSSSSFAIDNPPKMLCFSTKEEDQEHPQLGFKSRQRSAHACSDSSSNSSGNGLKFEFKLKRRNGSNPETAAIKEASKKTKPEVPCSAGHAKRKEKLGERITALQQLVSPFGKTDTASVLHEAMGYIKFLHEQVQVLCSPYLQKSQLLSSQSATERENGETEGDLKSRGLCLIPVDCSLHLANCTVADFWSPAMATGRSFEKKKRGNGWLDFEV